MRRALTLGLALALAVPAPAAAFPDKPVELTVLFGAGSAADLLARKLAELAAKDLGQPVAVVNRTGAGGALGYTYVKGQPADGHALVWNSNSISTAYHAGNMKLDYTAFAGVAGLTSEPVSLAVKADAPWKDVRELLAYARGHPGQVRVGNSGRGSFTHLAAVALENRAGVKLTHVPFGRELAVITVLGQRRQAAGLPARRADAEGERRRSHDDALARRGGADGRAGGGDRAARARLHSGRQQPGVPGFRRAHGRRGRRARRARLRRVHGA
ncbi:MAG: tripartite tricarboxylate transporter substrate binding protein [Candidatus Rokuibacteriota bacterium]|nr:MAG: tripartite tricarboxylate transporter substrate binding protein [Candidatus Rokubacteria bacterium]